MEAPITSKRTILEEGRNCWRTCKASRAAFRLELDNASQRRVGASWIRLTVAIALLVGLGLAWRWLPLREWLDIGGLFAWKSSLEQSPIAGLVVMLLYVAGSLLLFPVTVLILTTAFAFGPWLGFAYALGGCVSGAAATYLVGRTFGRKLLNPARHAWLDRWSRRAARHGVFAVTAVRLVPVGHFTIVNMVAGISHIKFRDFIAGTILGMIPGILGLTVFEQQLENVSRSPDLQNLALLGGVAVLLVAGAVALQHWIRRKY